MIGNLPLPYRNEALLGLARILYQWNELDTAEQYAQHGLQLVKQLNGTPTDLILSNVFLACLKLTHGDITCAAAILAQAEQSVRQNNFV